MSRHAFFRALGLCALTALLTPSHASAAWLWDQNQNKIDDRIEAVETQGIVAAHLGGDLTRRLTFAVFGATAPFEYGVYVGYDHHPTDQDAAALAATGAPVQVRYFAIDYIRSRVTFAQVQAIAQLPGVRRIETIPVMHAVNDIATRTLRARDSGGELFPSVWRDLGATGHGIVVGVLDTGVNDEADPSSGYPGHESLRGKFVGGGTFFAGDPALNTPPDSSMNPKHAADPLVTFHGTHVAGTAIGSGGPQGLRGPNAPGFLAGLAPDARLVDVKVLSDEGTGLGTADGLDWCIHNRFNGWGLTGADTVYRGIDVINLSVGGDAASDGTDANALAVNAAHRAGIVVCVASGNDYNTAYMPSPASADLALTVGSFTDNNTVRRQDDIVADYSNEGPRLSDGDADHLDEMKPNVMGSGTGITSALGDPTTAGDQYHHINGTSMACPTVAGVAALVLSANPGLSADDVRQILMETAEHRRDGGKQPPSAADPFGIDPNYHPSWGWGQVDAYAAVKEAQNAATVQVVRIAATPVRGPDGIRVDWWSQREVALSAFEVDRASDAFGGPGAWTPVHHVDVEAPVTAIQRVANRHAYSFTDLEPSLDPHAFYWYRVRWVDGYGRSHAEPPLRSRIIDSPVIMRAKFSWTHNYADGDLLVKYGSGTDTTHPNWVRFAPGPLAADSVKLTTGSPPLGTERHFFHFDFTAEDDGLATYLPPSAANPWFLSVKEGGFADTHGRVNDFSVTVFAGATSTTYASPQPTTETVEKQETVMWIPAPPQTSLNHAPVLSPIGPRSVGEGLLLRVQVAASDPDGQPLTYSATGLPAGATFDPATHRFEWTPAYTDAGSYVVHFQVVDNALPAPASDGEDVTITVTDRAPGDNVAPELDPLTDRQTLAGSSLGFRVTGRDPEGSALTFGADLAPTGATLDPASGAFQWTPGSNQLGTHLVAVRATDGGGASDRDSFYVVVSEPGLGPQPPIACNASSSILYGVVGMGTDPGDKDVQYHVFTVPQGTQRLVGEMTFFGAPAIDLDFYLLDEDSVQVKAGASVNSPEVIVVDQPPPGTYYWKVVAFTNPDTANYSIRTETCVPPPPSAVNGRPSRALWLAGAVPNPSLGAARIAFSLPEAGRVSLKLFDISGRLVRTLQDGWLPAGEHGRTWDRRSTGGTYAAAGVYFYRLEFSGRTLTRKAVMVR